MDDLQIRRNIDKIFESYGRGFRDFFNTVNNLQNLHNTLDLAGRDKFFDHLFFQLTELLKSSPDAMAAPGRAPIPSRIGLIVKAIGDFGPADTLFLKLFGYLDVENVTVTGNWEREVFSEMTSAIYLQPGRLSQDAVNALKDRARLYAEPSHSGLAGIYVPPALATRAAEFVSAIENREFSEFEAALKKSAVPATSESTALSSAEPLERILSISGIDTNAASAMTRAREYLAGSSTFDPKTAADLIRSSIDEVHREIVRAIGQAKAILIPPKDSDGERRAFMRKTGFISAAEEKFFSAIYALLSEEASHRLIAPKETILVLEQTVRDYFLLLARRISEFKANKTI